MTDDRKDVTINDIARLAGVSPSTVSRVLNKSKPVTPATEAAVQAAIDQLGFRPNLVAQGLARGRSTAIGVLIEELTSPFYGAIMRGIEDALANSGFYPIFASTHWRPGLAALDRRALDMLLGRRVDGILIVGSHVPDAVYHELADQMPLLIVGELIPGFEANCLVVDNRHSADALTRHLIQLGHRRIAHISGLLENADGRERLEGYQRSMAEAGLPELVIAGDFTESSGILAVDQLIRDRTEFSAIFAANDQMAMGAALALHRHGRLVPCDVSLAGFDDLPLVRYSIPPLTTVRQPTHEMGLAAARGMLDLIAGRPLSLPSFATTLVVRESTAAPGVL